jgi:23S rRNA (pseudouridine1915-N3)-methyltransferase
MRLRILWEARTKNEHLRALEADYGKRIARFVDLSVEEFRPARHASGASGALSRAETKLLERLQGCYKVFLDAQGREWTSEEFAEWLGQRALGGTRELAFVVGGPDGFSAAFRERADLLLSLSRMTFTHDLSRVLLLEQIYRAFTILRGYPYPR